jgi:hypothetical protein
MLLEAWSPTNQQLSQLLADLIDSDPALRVRLAKAKVRGRIVGWPLATFNPKLPVIANRVVLLGDAAGLIDPLNGEGIQYALRSARWSSEALRGAVSIDSLSTAGLRPYALRVEKEMRYDMALSRLIIDLAKNRTMRPFWLSALEGVGKTAAADSEYYNAVAGVFGGVVPARALLSLPFVWRTLKSAALARCVTAIEGFGEPRLLLRSCASLTKTVASMIINSFLYPVATLDWAVDCASSALELTKQMALSVVERLPQSHKEVLVNINNGNIDMPSEISSKNSTGLSQANS